MEGCRFCSLHSSSALTTTVPCSVPPRNVGFSEKPLFLQGQVLKFPRNSKTAHKCSTRLKLLNIRAQASGTPKLNPKESSKDQSLAFVAGATGRVGSRAVRELLKLGFRVRAGVRSADKAQALVQSVKEMNVGADTRPVEKLEIVQCDLEKNDQIGPALGNASVVLCCIGASEKEVFDITGPYRIDYLATKNLIEAANVANVEHFILLTSLGTNKVGFPAAILNLFWGVLIWKRKAEEALIASGLPYTIVRPGGMERPTDAYKETHNITLSREDTLFGGQVSNLQVAELMACMAKNRALSYCKVVEVVAETSAPLTPMEDLLKKIPSQRAGGFPSEEAKVPDLAPPKSEDPKYSAAEEPVKAKETAPRPSSPYTAYEDLKLPASPTPTPSTTAGAAKASAVSEVSKAVVQDEVVKAEVKKTRPSSPFTAYENLKPPSSPSPTPSGLQKPPPPLASSSPSPGGNDATNLAIDGAAENGPPKISTYCLSPYPAYEDLKPPSSPSPTPPSTSKS